MKIEFTIILLLAMSDIDYYDTMIGIVLARPPLLVGSGSNNHGRTYKVPVSSMRYGTAHCCPEVRVSTIHVKINKI